jgi:hypothetical protein
MFLSAHLALNYVPEEDAPLLQELGIDFNDIMKVNCYNAAVFCSVSHVEKKTMAVLHPNAALDATTVKGGDLAGMRSCCFSLISFLSRTVCR